jgi:hypothetical protein
MSKSRTVRPATSMRGLSFVVLTVALLALLWGSPASQASPMRPINLKSCGQVNAPGTPYGRFAVRASRVSCRKAETILLAWAHHPTGSQQTHSGWHCRLGAGITPWFYCAASLNRSSSPIAEAYHPSNSSSAAPSVPVSHPSAETTPPITILKVSLLIEQPAIGFAATLTIDAPTPGVAYKYLWLACPHKVASGCVIINGVYGPQFAMTEVCGVSNPYYLEGTAASVNAAGDPVEVGAIVDQQPIPETC